MVKKNIYQIRINTQADLSIRRVHISICCEVTHMSSFSQLTDPQYIRAYIGQQTLSFDRDGSEFTFEIRRIIQVTEIDYLHELEC